MRENLFEPLLTLKVVLFCYLVRKSVNMTLNTVTIFILPTSLILVKYILCYERPENS